MQTVSAKKGFGIIEVLIASTIIVATLFALTAAGKGTLSASSQTQEKAVGMNLAQEGIEIVRQIRDTSWIDQKPQTDWDSLVFSPSGSWSAVEKDGSLYDIHFDSSSTRFYLAKELDTSSLGEEIHLGNNDSDVYYRKIKIESAGNLLPQVDPVNATTSNQIFAMKVTATVSTPAGKTESISELLTNWRPQY